MTIYDGKQFVKVNSRRKRKRADEFLRKTAIAKRKERALRICNQSFYGNYSMKMIDTSVFYGN